MIGKHLTKLAKAIAEYEGWSPDNLSSTNTNEETIAFRNNNPGNLRYSPFQIGLKNGFAYFYDEQVGYFALLYDLFQKARGNTSTSLTPTSTIADLISVYAPQIENDTNSYIEFVEQKSGLNRTMQLQELLQE